jgi:hypothetical protein
MHGGIGEGTFDVARWSSVITIAVCVSAMIATGWMFIKVANAQDAVEFAVAFGTWAVLPYLANLAAAVTFVHRKIASSIVAVGSVIIALFGVRTLYHTLNFFFEPLPPGAGRCGPPFVEVFVPLLHWVGAFVLVLLAWLSDVYSSRHWPRYI